MDKKYFVHKADNLEDFCDIQRKLFIDGYSWFNNDKDIFIPPKKYYPLYITNLPYMWENENGDYYYNNGYFSYTEKKNNINFNKLRLEKLKKLNNV